jgi:enoyl-CoA hydratase
VPTTQIRRSVEDGVLTMTFTRPEKLNAVSPEMIDALYEAVLDLGENDDLRVLVIAAEGRFFTAGIDIGNMGASHRGIGPSGKLSPARLRRDYRKLHLVFDEMESIEKPVVLAAQGPCLGVGVEISGSCDFRLASTAATFGLPEVRNLAVVPGSGGVSRITRLVGPHWGKWLAMAGENVDADLALTMGLVHAVYPVEEFTDRVNTFARKLAGLPAEAMGVAKMAVDTAASVDRRTARDFDRFANTVLIMSDEHKDMTRAFNERKK